MISINNLSRMSILTNKLSNFSKPHKSIKFLFLSSLSSKKFKPNVGGLML